jgi:hypothetical protein
MSIPSPMKLSCNRLPEFPGQLSGKESAVATLKLFFQAIVCKRFFDNIRFARVLQPKIDSKKQVDLLTPMSFPCIVGNLGKKKFMGLKKGITNLPSVYIC